MVKRDCGREPGRPNVQSKPERKNNRLKKTIDDDYCSRLKAVCCDLRRACPVLSLFFLRLSCFNFMEAKEFCEAVGGTYCQSKAKQQHIELTPHRNQRDGYKRFFPSLVYFFFFLNYTENKRVLSLYSLFSVESYIYSRNIPTISKS